MAEPRPRSEGLWREPDAGPWRFGQGTTAKLMASRPSMAINLALRS